MSLTDDERAMLELERDWWKHPGGKNSAIRARFGGTSTDYYRQLNALIDRPEALAVDPLVVKRLRRLRDTRARQRAARRLGFLDVN